jgi:hypothetical protein
MSSRFAGIGRAKAQLVFVVLLIFIALSIAMPRLATAPFPIKPAVQATTPASEPTEDGKDVLLYRAINERVANGENYYAVAAAEHRDRNYPLKPFVTIRPPTLAALTGLIGPIGLNVALWLLMAATVYVWWQRLSAEFLTERHRPLAVFLIGLTVAAHPKMAVMHESWAGVLILLSIGLHDRHRWWPSVLTGFLAVAFREIALPYLLLMAALAVLQRRWSEGAGWLAAIGAEAAYLVWHASEVAKVVLPNDIASQGWLRAGGWPYAFTFLKKSTVLNLLPAFVSQVLIALTLFGWLAWKQMTGLISFLLICGYAIVFMIVGRPENFYWGMLVGPLLFGGLVFVPRALRDLWTESRLR